jgi:hypothetical protein
VRHHRDLQRPRLSAADRLSQKYAHAVMRLRHRYGLDMTLEQYRQLSDDARAGRGKGCRDDEAGNRDIWVKFKGRWVSACIRAGSDTISTFLPPPPDLPPEALAAPASNVVALVPSAPAPRPTRTLTDEADARANKLQLDLDHVLHELGKAQHRALQAEANEALMRQKADDRAALLVQTQAASGRHKRQASRLKRGCTEAVRLLGVGAVLDAAGLLDGLASMPQDADPDSWEPENRRASAPFGTGWRWEAREP